MTSYGKRCDCAVLGLEFRAKNIEARTGKDDTAGRLTRGAPPTVDAASPSPSHHASLKKRVRRGRARARGRARDSGRQADTYHTYYIHRSNPLIDLTAFQRHIAEQKQGADLSVNQSHRFCVLHSSSGVDGHLEHRRRLCQEPPQPGPATSAPPHHNPDCHADI